MNRILYAFLAIATLASCSKNYNITGSSNLSRLDGNMLFLVQNDIDGSKNIDSCDVVHGEFKFSGSYDSTMVAMICINNDPIIPVVIEDGDIHVSLNTADVSCKGTQLNDSLNAFLKAYEKLNSQLQDIARQMQRAEYDFYTNELEDPQATQQKIINDQMKLQKDMDDLFTVSVVNNFENVVGPFIFLYRANMETGGYYQLTPWIESILSKAPNTFKNNALIKDYVTNAQRNKNIENGTETPEQAPIQAPVQSPTAQEEVPTPAQMGESN